MALSNGFPSRGSCRGAAVTEEVFPVALDALPATVTRSTPGDLFRLPAESQAIQPESTFPKGEGCGVRPFPDHPTNAYSLLPKTVPTSILFPIR